MGLTPLMSEAWAKRRYSAHFVAKLTDADGELQETIHWLKSAHACGYLDETVLEQFSESALVVGRQLGSMIMRHQTFCFPPS